MSQQQYLKFIYTILKNDSICIHIDKTIYNQDFKIKISNHIIKKYEKYLKPDKINLKGRIQGWVFLPPKNFLKVLIKGKKEYKNYVDTKKSFFEKKIKQLQKKFNKDFNFPNDYIYVKPQEIMEKNMIINNLLKLKLKILIEKKL